jgi:hypothetical protein
MEATIEFGPVTVLSQTGYIDAASFRQLFSEAGKVLDTGHVNLFVDLKGE